MVEKSSRGNAGSFKLLYETLVGRVFGYLASRTDRTTATDLTQDCFVEIYKALPSFKYRSEPEFHSFVFIIVKRMLAKHYDSKHTKAGKTASELSEENMADETGDREMNISIEQALAALDDTTREIIVLHHWSRYTFRDIAAMVKMSEAAVRTRHHRALATLQAHLTSA
jgi:RNA polymerase sigma-70 factor (ECF subfamily)